ncbi:Cleavage stimulation factor subunit 3-like, partial [Globisporangium splendens]
MEPLPAEKPPRAAGSDDSSEEDEPITTAPSTVAVAAGAPATGTGDELSKAWMNAEDEEEEDAEWSQLPPADGSATAAAPQDPHESKHTPKFKRCLVAVEKDQWNADAWIALMNEVQLLPVVEARAHYEKFLELYPTSGRWWKLYAEHELREKNYERVQEIIKKSLMQIRCPNVDLWRFYLNFTKVVKVDVAVDSRDPEAIRTARQLMCDAFELALERVGGSIHAAPIWQSYLAFVQDDTDPQAFLNVRKLFHRAVAIPLHNMEAIWREYEKFERSIPNNEALAQNFFKVFRPKFDAARAVLRDRKKLFDHVNINALAVPSTGSRTDAAQMTDWQKILAFEMGNPERLDPLRMKSRMRYTLELFVSVKRHYPEAWYQYAVYENEASDRDAATSIFERALDAIPDSTYLYFAFADHHELHGDIPAAKAIYEKVIKEHVSALAYVSYQRFARRAFGAKGLTEARNVFKRARKDEREGAYFLGHLNDDNNMRSLFEKVLAVMPVEVSRPIWDRYVEFEHTMVSNGGDLATVAKVEARRAQAFPDAPFVEMKGLLSISHRYSFLDLKPPAKSDQTFLELYGASKRAGSGAAAEENGEENGGQAAGPGVSLPFTGTTIFPGLEGNGGLDVDRQVPGPPLPDFLKEFASMLPLNLPWNGPIADVEHIYRAMLLVDFPPRSQIEHSEKLRQQQQIQHQMALQQQQQVAEAEKHGRGDDGGDGPDGSGPGVTSKRPAHDVFRSRQKQKLAKLG